MFLEEVDKLLNPGYLPMETGYYHLPNGQWHIAVLTMMPGCKREWVDWWFHNYISDQAIVKIKNPLQLLSGPYQKENPEYSLKANPYGKHLTLGKLLNRQHFHFIQDDPNQYFDTVKLKNVENTSVICTKSVLQDDTLDANIIHIVRDTDFGCEMRSRFWTYHDTEDLARSRLEHYASDMCEVAQFLKMLIHDRQPAQNLVFNVCKYCRSSEIVKNGIKKGSQYWLCKKCGHSFTDNQALPRMKYPTYIVLKSVQSYLTGRSLKNICKDIEREYNILPSNSTVFGWVKKVNKMSIKS